MLTERAVDNLLNAGAHAFEPLPSCGNQHVFGIGAGVVAAVHAGLRVQQVEEVVEVLYATSLQSFVDVLFCQLVQLHPGETLHRANLKAPGFSQFDSLTCVSASEPHGQNGIFSSELPDRQALHVDQLHRPVMVLNCAVADGVAVFPGWVCVNQ